VPSRAGSTHGCSPTQYAYSLYQAVFQPKRKS